jgi:hypothetical protein
MLADVLLATRLGMMSQYWMVCSAYCTCYCHLCETRDLHKLFSDLKFHNNGRLSSMAFAMVGTDGIMSMDRFFGRKEKTFALKVSSI